MPSRRASSALAPPADPRLRRLDALGHLLDASIRIPGTRWRFGLDPLIGLVPGLGDGMGAILSAYIILEAARFGAPKATLLRMAGNVALETLVGVIPLLGDLFDAAWKANLRNLRLLHAHLEAPGRAGRASRRWVGAVVGGILLFIFGMAVLAIWLAAVVLRALGAL